MPTPKTATLLVDCPDGKGLVLAIINFLVQVYDVNILHADQHQDSELGLFFMRVEFSTDVPNFTAAAFRTAFEPVAQRYRMNWRIEFADEPAERRPLRLAVPPLPRRPPPPPPGPRVPSQPRSHH